MKIEIDVRGLEEEKVEKLRGEESEDDKKKSSKEEIREKKRRRDTIRLLKIIRDVVKEEEIRQFVEKVCKKKPQRKASRESEEKWQARL